jgi:ketopantoate reductase
MIDVRGAFVKIAVVGLGGVGGYFGGKIARKYAGSPEYGVVFIARGAHRLSLCNPVLHAARL